VRRLCDPATMQRVADAAWESGAAVPGLPATETIQRVSARGRVLATPPREELYTIQTPQCFYAKILRSALERARAEGFVGTDESSVVRWAGHPVKVVPGAPMNIKVTRPLDLALAEWYLSEQRGGKPQTRDNEAMIRIGQGIDYHRLAGGRKLILGAVEIPFEKGLEGHSDADALIHAVCDALLGAAALGDIGQHFPDTDPANRGRASLEFLSGIREKVEAAGWIIANVDTTILAQRPKLAPFMLQMRRNIAGALGIPIDRVSVKATTTEGLNAEGRGEGISAQSIAVITKA
jgi:2-C-methyl-D-erythritol 4-phosphate cytidylyltransferase / 2-C-methyl-D-erythritol 2,4-cyclodiphosphate synthase